MCINYNYLQRPNDFVLLYYMCTDDVINTTDTASTSTGVPIGVPSIPYTHLDCHNFFSDRKEVVERALADCQRDLLSSTEEEQFVGSWLLTEYDLF